MEKIVKNKNCNDKKIVDEIKLWCNLLNVSFKKFFSMSDEEIKMRLEKLSSASLMNKSNQNIQKSKCCAERRTRGGNARSDDCCCKCPGRRKKADVKKKHDCCKCPGNDAFAQAFQELQFQVNQPDSASFIDQRLSRSRGFSREISPKSFVTSQPHTSGARYDLSAVNNSRLNLLNAIFGQQPQAFSNNDAVSQEGQANFNYFNADFYNNASRQDHIFDNEQFRSFVGEDFFDASVHNESDFNPEIVDFSVHSQYHEPSIFQMNQNSIEFPANFFLQKRIEIFI